MNDPIRLDLEITRRCKFKCSICSVNALPTIDNDEVSLQSLKDKVFEFYKMNGKEVSITGGEPSERGIDFLVNLISYCKKLNLSVRMYSVGYGFQNFNTTKILKNAGLDCVIITLAGTKEFDEFYKGVRGSYEIALNATTNFRKAGVEVILHFTPTKLNFDQLPHVVNVAYDLGVQKIRIMAFVPQGRGWNCKEKFQMNENEKSRFKKIVEDLQSKVIDLQFSGSFDFLEGKSSCLIAKNRFVVTSDGLLIPSFAVRMNESSNVPNPEICLGTVDTVKLENAWNSELMVNARKNHKCSNCPACIST